MKKISSALVLLAITLGLQAQEIDLYKRVVEDLSSSKFQGRGYAMNGVRKAGKYLEKEFAKAGAAEVVTQPFCIDINTFPGKMEMSVDGRRLTPGSEFSMREYSPGAHGEYALYYVDTLNYDSQKLFAELAKPENKDVFVVCDFWFTYRHKKDFSRLQTAGESNNAGVIFVWNTPLKFYKAYGEKVADKPIVWVSSSFPENAGKVKLDIDNKFLSAYESDNVLAKVNGESHDSCFVFLAHYDHLGNLGRKLYFPGTNDNASGTAALVALTSFFSKNKPKYDVYCLAVSGEEANLRGSSYFVEHPLFSLEKIAYLFDLDMIGDNNPQQYCEVSQSGMAGYEKMVKLNEEGKWFEKLKLGELAANSDHYPFSMKGVPCIMFENEEGDNFKYYHTAEDNWDKVVFETYLSVFNLVTAFVK